MPVGDKQQLITSIVAEVLGESAQEAKTFRWFINQHSQDEFQWQYNTINRIFQSLNGSTLNEKGIRTLVADAYFGGQYNFLFEFDEFQHFSSARLKTLEFYSENLVLGYNIEDWKNYCNLYKSKADKYRQAKKTVDFDFIGGRTAQRAYLDCFRDLLPSVHGLAPTLRISEFEVIGIERVNIENCKKVEKILKSKLPH